MAENFSEFLEFAVHIAQEAGKLLLKYHKKPHARTYKRDNELVTRADKASDKLIRQRIMQRFPMHSIISEETDDYETGSEYKWVIDPLDGTYPFSYRHINHWGVCIALCKARVPCVGVVFAPERNEQYSAMINDGAECNGKPIRTSEEIDLKKSFIGLDVAVRIDENMQLVLNTWKNVKFTHSSGCASVPMCLTARGVIPGYIAAALKPWDMAAAVVINREAGNKVTNRIGEDWLLGDRSIVIANPILHPKLMKLFR